MLQIVIPTINLVVLFFFAFLDLNASGCLDGASPRILHLTFHRGCEKEFEGIAEALSVQVETWFIPDLPPQYFDGITTGNALYNIGHERAQRIWDLHQAYFEAYDMILISDTAPLSRIFLQNNFKKPLIIWICNRFDYHDQASLDCEFPDEEFYSLFREAKDKKNVSIIAYTAFEHYYAKSKGVDTGGLIITPCSPLAKKSFLRDIPGHIKKEETFFLPPYHNERFFMDLEKHLTSLNIPSYCGRYNGPLDLVDFKGIIHLPYAWSNLAFFENVALGIPYFIPSEKFFRKLASQGNYFHPQLSELIEKDLFYLSEWYSLEHQDVVTYFDSWEDLSFQLQNANFQELHKKILSYGQNYRESTLDKWKKVIQDLTNGYL